MTLTPESKTVLINRLKSFAWREGALLSLAALGFISNNIGLWGFSATAQALALGTISIIVGEITKFLNK